MALGKSLVVAARLSAAAVLSGSIGVLCADGPARADSERHDPGATAGAALLRGVSVIDAVTFAHGAALYRLANAEIADAGVCAAAGGIRDQATSVVTAMLGRARRLSLEPTGRLDVEGRQLVFASIDGRDLGELLMAQGLARSARLADAPWCDAAGRLLP